HLYNGKATDKTDRYNNRSGCSRATARCNYDPLGVIKSCALYPLTCKVPPVLSNIRATWLETLAGLPEHTRIAWRWDLLTGAFAGMYQGCIWTFVLRIARADMHATGSQMGWITASPALGYIFATLWARQMEGKSKLPFVYWTWLAARGMFLLTPL